MIIENDYTFMNKRCYRVSSNSGVLIRRVETGEVKPYFSGIKGNDTYTYEETSTLVADWEREQKYKNRIIQLIRLRYDENDELALIHQKEQQADEYAAYLAYRQECKDKAKAEIYG